MADEKDVDRATCWIDRALLKIAKEIAVREDKTIPEVLEKLLRPALTKLHTRLFVPSETGEAGA